MDAILDPAVETVVQVAPAVRAAWGEGVGLSRAEATPGRLAAALHAVGFDKVFDTDFAADLTIMEEGSEFVEFLGSDNPRPMFTSCCPGWVRFVKLHYPEFTAQLSSAKSPHQMMGAVVKNTLAAEAAEAGKRLFVVSIMPCVAKKYECDVPELATEADADVDAVLTVREFDRLLRMVGVNCAALTEIPFDNPLGLSTGAATIFGRTGGVMEAALRSAAFLITGQNPDFSVCDTTDATPETPWISRELPVGDATVRIAVASGLENTAKLLDALESGEAAFDFVEIMACPGRMRGWWRPAHPRSTANWPRRSGRRAEPPRRRATPCATPTRTPTSRSCTPTGSASRCRIRPTSGCTPTRRAGRSSAVAEEGAGSRTAAAVPPPCFCRIARTRRKGEAHDRQTSDTGREARAWARPFPGRVRRAHRCPHPGAGRRAGRSRSGGVRGRLTGTRVFARGLIEFTNICATDCYYCGIRRSNRTCERYRLTPRADSGLRRGRAGRRASAPSCCRAGKIRRRLTSGWPAWWRNLKAAHPGCAVTLSVGERSQESYRAPARRRGRPLPAAP